MAFSMVAWLGCGDETGNAPPIDPSAGMTVSTVDGTGTDGSGSSSSADGSSSSGPAGPSNCGELQCTGHGACEVDGDNMPYCACDPGYRLDLDGVSCVVDESCVQVRFLEDHCRQLVNGPPAVSLFFAVDFCSGTAVTPDDIERLGLEFHVLENGVDIADNIESYATIIDKSVESYVTIVLDVSDSVTMSQDLPALVDELRTFVAALVPEADDPDVYVSVHVFGRDTAEYVPFTRDLAGVDQSLAAIAVDPAPVVLMAGNGLGSDLYAAVAFGIDRTQRIRDLRDAVTWGGVLTTGTVVVVTDGNDQSNGMLDTAQIDATTNNVISIGLSNDIDDQVLRDIGRDGSFLAPTVADWTSAFAEIAERVDRYPSRSYLLGYCSPATVGEPDVEVTVEGIGVTSSSAVCNFDADVFTTDPLEICNATYLASECNDQQCGGLTACGACSDDACCDGRYCIAPMNATQAGLDCEEQPELCAVTDQVCFDLPDDMMDGPVCTAPAPANGVGCDPGCQLGVTWCDVDAEQCVPVLQPEAPCDAPEQCPELNCSRVNEDNPLSERICRGQALLHDSCGSDEAGCEQGGYCNSGECKPKQYDNAACTGDEACRSGLCEPAGDAGNLCNGVAACFWTWDEKVPF